MNYDGYDISALPGYAQKDEDMLPPLSAWDGIPKEKVEVEVVEYQLKRITPYEKGIYES